MSILQSVLLWLLLNILIGITMELAFFMQTMGDMKNAPMYEKIFTSQFWATMEWIFVIPAQRIGITFFNPAQLAMSSYVFDFISQIASNSYWLKLKTTVDDYVGMGLILFGMFATKFQIFG